MSRVNGSSQGARTLVSADCGSITVSPENGDGGGGGGNGGGDGGDGGGGAGEEPAAMLSPGLRVAIGTLGGAAGAGALSTILE